MDILTLYVGQGALTGVRIGNEGIIVDAHMPDCEDVNCDEIRQTLEVYFRNSVVRGLVLTGLDADHAHAGGVEWLMARFAPDWVMYPKYFKDTDCARDVFNSINKVERRRASTARPLTRHSIRIDRLEDRVIAGLGQNFSLEVFSPHPEDMDNSNNSSIVAKLTGTDVTGFRYLITGDTETDRWETIGRLFGKYLASDVMAAAHHGATTGVHPKTLLAVRPNTVLISAGVDSQFDHPRGAAVRVYQEVAKHVWATNAGNEGKNLLTQREGTDFSTRTFGHAATAAR